MFFVNICQSVCVLFSILDFGIDLWDLIVLISGHWRSIYSVYAGVSNFCGMRVVSRYCFLLLFINKD